MTARRATHSFHQWLLPALLTMLAPSLCLSAELPVRIEQQTAIHDLTTTPAAGATHALALTVANIAAWPEPVIVAALRQAAQLLAQCDIRMNRADLLHVTVPETHRYFDTPRSRELARALNLPKPTLYFAAGTRQTPAFDAEAIGRGNSSTRPELADTVWIARGTRDLGLVVAHELAHVLMNSGAHDNTPGNLMAESTTPDNTRLTATQCAQIRNTGARNGLLHPGVN